MSLNFYLYAVPIVLIAITTVVNIIVNREKRNREKTETSGTDKTIRGETRDFFNAVLSVLFNRIHELVIFMKRGAGTCSARNAGNRCHASFCGFSEMKGFRKW